MNVVKIYHINDVEITQQELDSYIGDDVKNAAAHLEDKGLHVFVINVGHFILANCYFDKIILVERDGIVVKAEIG